MPDKRVMIVADAAGAPEVASGVLARFGVSTVVTASRLDQALTRLRAEPFDLLILPLQEAGPAQLELLEREIRAQPTLAVIGTAPVADPDLILCAMRTGVHEFLISPPAMDDLANAVERLSRRSGVVRTGRVIAVYSAKGGLGTTSIAVNVADAYAASAPARSVALIDGVFTGGDIQVVLNLQPIYDLGDLVKKLDEVDGSMLRSLMTTGPHNMCILPAPNDPVLEDAFDGATVSTIIDHLRTNFETTIVDCEHQLSERTLAVLDAADRILLVTQPSVPALRSAKRTLELFQRLGYDAGKIAVIMNRFQFGDVFTLRNVADSLAHPVYWALPNDYQTAAAALNKGVTVATEDSASKLAQSFEQLADKVRGGPEVRSIAPPPAGAAAAPDSNIPRSRLRNFFVKQNGANRGA